MHRPKISVSPTIIFGCGGSGTLTVYYVKEMAKKELFNGEEGLLKEYNLVKFFVVDTTKQILEKEYKSHEIDTIEIACNEINKIISDPFYPSSGNKVKAIRSLFPDDVDYNSVINKLPRTVMGAGTCPPLGRMNFLGSWEKVYSQIKQIIQNSWPIKEITEKDKNKPYQIFIIASLYGGTGAGIFIDFAAMLRYILTQELKFNFSVSIYGIFYLPNFIKSELCEANAYACLKELNHFESYQPYVLEFANGKKIVIKNRGEEVLFNKIFLIGNRNFEGEDISFKEAAEMVANVIFHWSFTELGEEIKKRLMDDPNRYTNNFVPENSYQKRITAFSSFGMATATIPYDILQNNLAVELAKEILENILCKNKSMLNEEDINKINEKKQEILKSLSLPTQTDIEKGLGKGEDLKNLGIDEGTINLISEFYNKSSLEKWTKSKNLKFIEKIRKKIQTTLSVFKNLDKETDEGKVAIFEESLKKFEEKIEEKKEECQKLFGFYISEEILFEIKQHIRNLNRKIQKRKREFEEQGKKIDLKEKIIRIEKILENFTYSPNLREILLQKIFPSKRKKRLEDLERVYRSIINELKKLIELFKLQFYPQLLEKYEFKLEEFCEYSEQEKKRVEKMFDFLEIKKKNFHKNTINFCPIQIEVLENYLKEILKQNFKISSIVRKLHEGIEISREIEKKIKGENSRILEDGKLTINEFDRIPEIATELLFEWCLDQVKSLDYWYKCFSDSHFYPLTRKTTISSLKKWVSKSYEKTWEELINRSSPFIEYKDGNGFTTFKQGFIIAPKTKDDEIKKWESFPLDANQKIFFIGDGKTSPYSISIIQFHYGFPLFALGKDGINVTDIENWKKNYQYYRKKVRRPLDKFNFFMEDILPNIQPQVIFSKEEVKEIYEWALEISKQGRYPIFVFEEDKHYLNTDSPEAIRLYFDVYKENYMDKNEIKDLIQNNSDFKKNFKKILEAHANDLINKQNSVGSEINELVRKNELIEAIEVLINKKASGNIIRIKDENIHVTYPTGEWGEFVKKYFYVFKPLTETTLKHVSSEEEINAFYNNTELLNVVIELCIEAHEKAGIDLPGVLKKKMK